VTSRRRGISPVPSRLGWRHCIDATSRSGILSQNAQLVHMWSPGACGGCSRARQNEPLDGRVTSREGRPCWPLLPAGPVPLHNGVNNLILIRLSDKTRVIQNLVVRILG
jgi:hypothetical protein